MIYSLVDTLPVIRRVLAQLMILVNTAWFRYFHIFSYSISAPASVEQNGLIYVNAAHESA